MVIKYENSISLRQDFWQHELKIKETAVGQCQKPFPNRLATNYITWQWLGGTTANRDPGSCCTAMCCKTKMYCWQRHWAWQQHGHTGTSGKAENLSARGDQGWPQPQASRLHAISNTEKQPGYLFSLHLGWPGETLPCFCLRNETAMALECMRTGFMSFSKTALRNTSRRVRFPFYILSAASLFLSAVWSNRTLQSWAPAGRCIVPTYSLDYSWACANLCGKQSGIAIIGLVQQGQR